MRIIYGNGYSEEERRQYIPLICRNVFTIMQSLIAAMEKLRISYGDESAAEKAAAVRSVKPESVWSFKDPFVLYIAELWQNPGIQSAYRRRREFQLTDSANFFLTELPRLSEENYVPTNQDILRVQDATAEIVEFRFLYHQLNFWIVDVGGLRSERRKWIRYFDGDGVMAVLFIVALSDYDQVRMHESIELFETILYTFHNSKMILFLNKKDIFKEKLEHSRLVDYFPEYEGPTHDADIWAREYILKMFVDLNDEHPKRLIYSHFTCATDTENMKFVFAAVIDTILDYNYFSFGLI